MDGSRRRQPRRHWIVLAAATAALWADAGDAVRIKDDINAFNGYTLGAPLSAYPSLKLVKGPWSTDFVQEVGVYASSGEVMTLNDVALTDVQYRFADKQLESIQITYAGRENREKLLRWIEDHYGTLLLAERKMINQVEWHGDQMTIHLSYNPGTKQGTLWFISPTLHHLVNKNINDMTE